MEHQENDAEVQKRLDEQDRSTEIIVNAINNHVRDGRIQVCPKASVDYDDRVVFGGRTLDKRIVKSRKALESLHEEIRSQLGAGWVFHNHCHYVKSSDGIRFFWVIHKGRGIPFEIESGPESLPGTESDVAGRYDIKRDDWIGMYSVGSVHDQWSVDAAVNTDRCRRILAAVREVIALNAFGAHIIVLNETRDMGHGVKVVGIRCLETPSKTRKLWRAIAVALNKLNEPCFYADINVNSSINTGYLLIPHNADVNWKCIDPSVPIPVKKKDDSKKKSTMDFFEGWWNDSSVVAA